MNRTSQEFTWSRNFTVASPPTPVKVHENTMPLTQQRDALDSEAHFSVSESRHQQKQQHRHQQHPVSPKRESLTRKSDSKTNAKGEEMKRGSSGKSLVSSSKGEEMKRGNSSKNVVSSPKEDASQVATATGDVFESPRLTRKADIKTKARGEEMKRGSSSKSLLSSSKEEMKRGNSSKNVVSSPKEDISKVKARAEEMKRGNSSKNVVSSPKEDAAGDVFKSPRRTKKATIPRRKSEVTSTQSPRSGTNRSGAPSPVPRSKSNPSPLKMARRLSATTPVISGTARAKSPCTPCRDTWDECDLFPASTFPPVFASTGTATIKPTCTPRRGSMDDCNVSTGSSSTPTSATMIKPPRTPRRGSGCDVSTMSTSTPTTYTSSTKSSGSPVKVSLAFSPPSKGRPLTSACTSGSSYIMAPRRFSLPLAPMGNSVSAGIDEDDDMQTVFTEVDFDESTVAPRVPHHFVLLEEPSTATAPTNKTGLVCLPKTTQLQRAIAVGGSSSGVNANRGYDDAETVFPEVDFDADRQAYEKRVPQHVDDVETVFPETDFDALPQLYEQRVPHHFFSEKASTTTTTTTTITTKTTTKLQRHIGGGSSGAHANHIDAATVFTEVDFGATNKLEKNPNRNSGDGIQKSRLLDITETVKLQSIGEQQEGGSKRNLLGGKKCHRRNSATDSPRKTKVKQKQPRSNSMSEEFNDDFPANPKLATRDNHHHPGTPLRSQRKQVMSELVDTQNDHRQQKEDRARIMDELTMGGGGGGGRKTQTLPLRFQRKQVMSELVVTQSEQQKQEQARARNHRKGMDELLVTQSEQQKQERARNQRKGMMDELLTQTPSSRKLNLKPVKRPPTPPRRRGRLSSSPTRRSSRQLLAKQPFLDEKIAITVRADNHHTHEWGPDAFPDNTHEWGPNALPDDSMKPHVFADNNMEHQNGNSTTDLDDSFSDSCSDFSASSIDIGLPVVRDPNSENLNESFSGLGSFLKENSRGKDTDLTTVCLQQLS